MFFFSIILIDRFLGFLYLVHFAFANVGAYLLCEASCFRTEKVLLHIHTLFPTVTTNCSLSLDICSLCSQDVLVVTAPGSGAEIIPFLKTWVNLPMAIAFTIGYAKV
jgi:hypothetical protein